jgi:hypothetical protein
MELAQRQCPRQSECFGRRRGWTGALGRCGRFETLHLALTPSCRLMRILSPIVFTQALFVPSRQSHFGLGRGIGTQFVGHQQIGCEALSPKQPAHQFTAAAFSRGRCTWRTRTSPSLSTARYSQNCRPAITTAISSDTTSTLGEGVDGEVLANNGPNFKTHRRTVS